MTRDWRDGGQISPAMLLCAPQGSAPHLPCLVAALSTHNPLLCHGRNLQSAECKERRAADMTPFPLVHGVGWIYEIAPSSGPTTGTLPTTVRGTLPSRDPNLPAPRKKDAPGVVNKAKLIKEGKMRCQVPWVGSNTRRPGRSTQSFQYKSILLKKKKGVRCVLHIFLLARVYNTASHAPGAILPQADNHRPERSIFCVRCLCLPFFPTCVDSSFLVVF